MLRRISPIRENSNLTNALMVLVVLLMVTACLCRSGRDAGQTEPSSSPAPKPVADAPANPSTKSSKESADLSKQKDEGDFIVEHVAVKNQKYAEIDRQIKEEKLLEKAANDLNRALILPNDIYVRAQDCGEINAFFDPRDQSVTMCYELMEHFYRMFRSAGDADQKAYDKMFDAVKFVFLHEIGHALISNYKLPIMGNEEDAADRLSSYVNIEELGEEGVKAVLAAADAFAIESKMKTPSGRDMADEHLLGEQRFYNSLCMIFGSNPNKYEYFVTDGYLPKERAVRCPSEFEKTVESWVKLLQPWRKDK